MNILFIFSIADYQSPEKPLPSPIDLQFGISYISSFLKSKGHKTKLLVLTRETSQKIIDKHLKKFNPKLVCFTSVASEYKFISKIAKYIKSNYPEKYLLIGGPHVTLNPSEAIKDSFDAVCVGEGESPSLELTEQLEKNEQPDKIDNLWIKNKNKIQKNKTREFIQDLDAFPSPDRGMWNEWINIFGDKHSILLGRGCPFQCTYCSNHALKKISEGKYVRFRSVDKIINELKEIVEEFPETKEVYFQVETIGINEKFAKELCSKLRIFNIKNKKLEYGINLRVTPNADYKKFFKSFKEANFKFINIGLESGSQRVREEILKRHYSNKDIFHAVKSAKKYGLKTRLFVMIGLPGENLKDFKETIKCCRICQPEGIYYGIFFPYAGTELYSYCKTNKLLPKNLNGSMERRKAVLDTKEFPKKEVQKQYIWFYYNVYKGYKPTHILLLNVIINTIKGNHIMNIISRRIYGFPPINKLIKQIKSP